MNFEATLTAILAPIVLFVVISVVLYIREVRTAKKEDRAIRTGYKELFITAMAIAGLIIILGALLGLFTILMINNM